jgi:hypothetical protein
MVVIASNRTRRELLVRRAALLTASSTRRSSILRLMRANASIEAESAGGDTHCAASERGPVSGQSWVSLMATA